MFNVRTLSIILAVIMVFGLASLAFAQGGTSTPGAAATGTSAAASAGAAATSTATTPGTLPTTGGTAAGWMLPLMSFVVLFLVAGLGLNLARRAR